MAQELYIKNPEISRPYDEGSTMRGQEYVPFIGEGFDKLKITPQNYPSVIDLGGGNGLFFPLVLAERGWNIKDYTILDRRVPGPGAEAAPGANRFQPIDLKVLADQIEAGKIDKTVTDLEKFHIVVMMSTWEFDNYLWRELAGFFLRSEGVLVRIDLRDQRQKEVDTEWKMLEHMIFKKNF